MDDYLTLSGQLLCRMRLLTEGASDLFESVTQPLYGLGLEHGEPDAALAYDVIGAALTELRSHVITLQGAYMQASLPRKKD